MKISVIAPNLNEEKYIGHFLRSLTLQVVNPHSVDVIIVDGGSTDRSLEIVERYKKDLDLKVISDSKRNIGYIRNLGSQYAEGDILLFTNSDTHFYFDSNLLSKICKEFQENPALVSLGGRCVELETNLPTKLSYFAFNILRLLFSLFPHPLKKYRPTANFLAIRKSDFKRIGGFPEVRVNEDGELGKLIDKYARKYNKKVVFSLKYRIAHYPKRFTKMGWFRAMSYYFYVLPNMFPFLSKLLKNLTKASEEVFARREYV